MNLIFLILICIMFGEFVNLIMNGKYIPNKYSDRILEYISEYRSLYADRCTTLYHSNKPSITKGYYGLFSRYYIHDVGRVLLYSKAHYAIKNKFKIEKKNINPYDKL